MGEEKGNTNHSYAPELYENTGVDYLLIYAAMRIIDGDEECTLERLVYECFTLFPKKFSLSTYPQWPDSTRVYRSWRRCRIDNKWLKGSPREGFKLTPKGQQVAISMSIKLTDPKFIRIKKSKNASRARGKEEQIVRYLRNSPIFQRWISSPSTFSISPSELRSLLNVTLETSQQILQDNLEYYKKNVALVQDEELLDFLRSLTHFLGDTPAGRQ